MRPRRAAVFVAPLGVVAGHAAGYWLAHPDAAARAHALAGHGWLPALATLGAGPALATLAGVTVDGARRRRHRPAPVALLAALQVGLFVGIELVEHVAGGAGLVGALREPGLWFGLPAQVLFAVLGALVLRAAHAVGAAAARARRTARRRRPPRLAATPTVVRVTATLPSPLRRRGPPVASWR